MKTGGRIGLVGLLALWVWGVALAQTLPREVRERIIAATVLITDGNGHGSGTLISPQGYILTNYHVIGDRENRRLAPRILVGTIRFVDQPPEVRYQAEVVAADPNLDLAIIRITRTANGQPIGNVTFPSVAIGDSNKLIVGDPIYAFGFQGTGGLTITLSTGVVGGFTGEDMESGGKQWIKHDAEIGPGSSGGGTYNQQGELIGINTRGVSGRGSTRTFYMRPIALAWGLIGPNVPGLASVQPQPSQPASSAWPPVISTGQTWQLRVQGGEWSGEWTLVVGPKDADGDFTATASLGSRRTQAVFFLRDNVLRLNLNDDFPLARCRFDPQSGGGAIQGKLFVIRSADADAEEIGTCAASLRAAQPQAAWPPRLAVGQRWQLSVSGPNLNDSAIVTLSELDSDGDPKGSAAFRRTTLIAFFYIASGVALLDMMEASSDGGVVVLRCRFERQNDPARLSGIFQTFILQNGQIRNSRDVGTCTASLLR